jgi:hypothetical protein
MKQTVEMSELWGWVMWTPSPGSELVALIRQLEGTFPAPAWVEGYGEVKDPVVLTQSDVGGRYERRLSGTWDLLSLRGSPKGELYALLARDSSSGPQQIGGLLAGAVVHSATLRVGAALPASTTAPAQPADGDRPTLAAAPPSAFAQTAPEPSLGAGASDTRPAPATAAPSSPGTVVAPTNIPKRPQVRELGVETYPEEGDIVTHFAFGRCLVLFSDGERLRLQQERDSRVREVAMSMLKVSSPTVDESGKRLWDLARKN